ncbi:hypothetical protein AAD001_17075 [Colwelliaceae bacterium 6471]
MKSTLLPIGVTCLIFLAGCNVAQESSTKQTSETLVASTAKDNKSMPINPKLVKVIKSDKELPELNWQQGTIRYLNLEGGFYGIITEDGSKLLPMNLKSEYRLDGAVVKVKGQLQKDVLTIQQWGTPFKITEIELLKSGSSVPASDQ